MGSRYQSCTLGDLARAADVDTRTFAAWLTETDQIEMIRLGHHITDRKLKPRVVAFLIQRFIPDLLTKES